MTSEIRAATRDDVPDLSKLLILAAGGVVDALYHGLIPGKPTNEIVERRLQREGTTGSYENCWVAVQDGRVVGELHAYPMDELENDPPDPLIPEERYAVLEPFDHLDPVAAGSYYINVVAVYPEFQGHGIGTQLLDLARAEAEARGFDQLSLVVAEQNRGAVWLYRRCGFEEAARHPAVRHEMIRYRGDMLLMMSEV